MQKPSASVGLCLYRSAPGWGAGEGTTPADAAIAYAVALGLVMGELSLSLARGDPETAQIGLARIMDLAATMGVRATLHFTTVPATDAGETRQ